MVSRSPYPDPGRPAFCARCGAPLEARRSGDRVRPACPVCGWVYYAKPALGAAVLIEIDGRLLLVQRKHAPYQGWWMLPAGFVEYGEAAHDAAVREAAEEVGLTVAIVRLRGLYYGTDDPRGVAHLAAYDARVLAGTPAPADDAAALATFGPAELPDRIAFQGQRAAIADWAAERCRARG